MEGMQPQGQRAPQAAQEQQGPSPEDAVKMIGQGLQSLVASAPSPEIAQQLEAIQQQLAQVLSAGSQQAGGPGQGQPISPEAGGNPGARPVG